jgi:cytochrome c biogenesis protein CcdA
MPRWYLAPVLPLVAGAVVLALAGGDTALVAIGMALAGLGAVLVVSLAFYAVGRSEDRERAKELERRRRPPLGS